MKKIVIVASLVCLFLFGGVCGFAIALRILKNSINEDFIVNFRIQEETKRLGLSTDQLEKAKPSYEQFKQDLRAVKRDTFQAIARAALNQSMELSKILTSEQADEFAKLNEERRLKFEKMVQP